MAAQKNAPTPSSNSGEGEIQNTNTHEGEPIDMSISETTDTDQTTEPLRPIYGPEGDERWGALQAWLDEHADELLGGTGADPHEFMRDFEPVERAEWYEGRVLGRSHRDIRRLDREIEYPDFRDTDTAPAWADNFDDAGTDHHDRPVRLWFRDIEKRANVPTAIIQLETFDVASDRVISDPIELSMWIGDDAATKFTSAERAREVARAILAAADEFENVLAFDRLNRGQVIDEQA